MIYGAGIGRGIVAIGSEGVAANGGSRQDDMAIRSSMPFPRHLIETLCRHNRYQLAHLEMKPMIC